MTIWLAIFVNQERDRTKPSLIEETEMFYSSRPLFGIPYNSLNIHAAGLYNWPRL